MSGREKFKTMHSVFDNFTNRTIFKLISEGHFLGLESPVAIGKESNVFTAKKSSGKVIVKIYRLETCDFNRMYDYLKQDTRYCFLKGKRRKTIFAWVQREYRNLLKAREAGVRVPLPITFQNNVLVMEHIGDVSPAPKLKDSIPENPKRFFDKVIIGMGQLYKAGIVHGDLSQFNILNNNEEPVFIDFSRGISLEAQMAAEYLVRDIKNCSDFFAKLGVKEDREETRKKILAYHKL